jgi:hypothetical protein
VLFSGPAKTAFPTVGGTFVVCILIESTAEAPENQASSATSMRPLCHTHIID